MSLWLDYSFARPSISQMKKDGVVGVLRYLAPDDANNAGKIIRPAERDALLAAHIDICLNWEWYSGRALEGYGAGVQDARAAEAEATALGYPVGKVIYFSHDTGTFNQSVIDYYRGVKDTLRRYKSGAYGDYEATTKLHAAGLIVHGWQTTAWSHGLRDPWTVIFQTGAQWYVGAADVDEVTSSDIGSWLDGPTVTDWWDSVDEATARRVIADEVSKQLDFYLPRVAGLIRFGTPNQAFPQPAEPQPLWDHKGISGEVADVETAVHNLTVGNGVDLSALATASAKATVDELGKRVSNG